MSFVKTSSHLYFDLREHASAEGVVAALLEQTGAEKAMREALAQAHLVGVGPQMNRSKRKGVQGFSLLWVDDKGMPLGNVREDLRTPLRGGTSVVSRKKRRFETKKEGRLQKDKITSSIEQDEHDAHVLHLSSSFLRNKEQNIEETLEKGRISLWLKDEEVYADALLLHLRESRLSPLTQLVAQKVLRYWLRAFSEVTGVVFAEVSLLGREALRGVLNAVAFASLLEWASPKSVRCAPLPRGPMKNDSHLSSIVVEQWSHIAAGHLLLKGSSEVGADPLVAAMLRAVSREYSSLPEHEVLAVNRGACTLQPHGWVWLQTLSFAKEKNKMKSLAGELPHLSADLKTLFIQKGAQHWTDFKRQSTEAKIHFQLLVEENRLLELQKSLLAAGAEHMFSMDVDLIDVEEKLHPVGVGRDKEAHLVRVLVRSFRGEEVFREVLAEDVQKVCLQSGFTPTSIEEEALMVFKKLTAAKERLHD